MSQTTHIQIASDCYFIHLKIRRMSVTSVLDVCFAFRDRTVERIRRFRHIAFQSPVSNGKTEGSLFTGRKASFSLVPEYGLRFIGNIIDFADGKSMLADITLRSRCKRGAFELFLADGSLLIGDEEYLFAPAHSTALIFSSNEKVHQQWISAISYSGIPSAIILNKTENIAAYSVLAADNPLYTQETAVSRQSVSGSNKVAEKGLILHFPDSDRKRDLCLVSGTVAVQGEKSISLNQHWFIKL